MPYATEEDIVVKWGDDLVTLAAFDSVTSARDSLRVQSALDSATALMNAYFCKRYTLPIDASPEGIVVLRDVCCDLAMGGLSNTPAARNDIVKEAEAASRKLLEAVAAGRADIPQNPPPGGPAAALSPNEAIVAANDRAFTRNRLRAM